MSVATLEQELVDRMPLYSLGILALVEAGIDIRGKMSGTTYTKHRALLRAYGFDIHPKVVEIERKRERRERSDRAG